MDETLLFPSPNWFQPAGLAVTPDDWIIYGGPSKSLCVLEPLSENYNRIVQGDQGYTSHVVNRAHPEKIVCVDICPEWPEKRAVLTGSTDGAVKQWSLEYSQRTLKIKSTHSHDIHCHEKEEVAGVGYCNNGYAVTVGGYGTIVKWDVNSNVAKSFNHVLKNFKPVCMACSPHIHMNVAIGTKQGVVFVLDLNGAPRIIYKVRGQDDEILKLSWCPQYEVAVRKALKETDKNSKPTNRMEKIRQEAVPPEVSEALDERVKKSQTDEKPIKINEKSEPIEDSPQKTISVPSCSQLHESGIGKTLPEDSFDDTIVVPEDDMFDIYKDHEADEFGHKKFQPTDILVKVVEEAPKGDYLTECLQLKEEILKRKEHAEASVTDLVHAMDKASIEDTAEAPLSLESKSEAKEEPKPLEAGPSKPEISMEGKIIKGEVESSVHIHKHLLATISKHGSIRVWSKSGKLVGSCAVVSGAARSQNQRQRNAANGCTTLLWLQPDILLIADGKSQLLDCNPLRIDCKNKLEWRVVHALHRRGLFALAAAAPRVQAPGQPVPTPRVYSAGQDRNLIAYDLKTKKAVHHMTCGGFIYTLSVCPYNARKIAMSVGDGAVRVWETDSSDTDEAKLVPGHVTAYWQGVQGKVLTHAWHPTREDWLAFGTAEARVGVINTSGGGSERPGRVLQPALGGGVYSLYWGEGATLYACGNGELVAYDASKPDDAPTPIAVEWQGQKWEVSVCRWFARGMLVGSCAGAAAVLAPQAPHTVHAATFVFNKIIHTMDWHPEETSSGSSPSPHRDLIAVCSLDKANTIAILHYGPNEEGSNQLSVRSSLAGHGGAVLQLMWSPHRDAQLLSTSSDGTVRVWDVVAESCTAVFGGHCGAGAALGATWLAQPALAHCVLSGGADAALRLWDIGAHAPHLYQETKHETAVEKKKRNRREKKDAKKEKEDSSSVEMEENAAAVADAKVKPAKKFLLPIVYRQTHPCTIRGPRRMLQKYLEKTGMEVMQMETTDEDYDIDYIKLFGNINDVNEVLDAELERHADTGHEEAWRVLGVARGCVDAVLTRAARHHALDPFLLSLAPSISFKYWKDATLLYLQQIDHLVAKGEEAQLNESKTYGGAVFRKVAVQLSLHDIKEAVATLLDARLFAEAYVLSRTRYMDSLAEQTLRVWAQDCMMHGSHNMAAVCFIALEDLPQATAALSKSSNEESLSLAAYIAKVLGQTTFAGHIEEKREQIMNKKEAEKESKDELKALPSRVDLAVTAKAEVAVSEEVTAEETERQSKSDDGKVVGQTEVTNQNVEVIVTDGVEALETKRSEIAAADEAKAEEKSIQSSIEALGSGDNVPEQHFVKNKLDDEGKSGETTVLYNDKSTPSNAEVENEVSLTPETKTSAESYNHLLGLMEGLLKDSIDITIRNSTHKGDGDNIQNNKKDEKVDIVPTVLPNDQEVKKNCGEEE